MTPLQKAWSGLKNELTGVNQAGEKFAHTIGGDVVASVTAAINDVSKLVYWLNQLDDMLHKMGRNGEGPVQGSMPGGFSGFAISSPGLTQWEMNHADQLVGGTADIIGRLFGVSSGSAPTGRMIVPADQRAALLAAAVSGTSVPSGLLNAVISQESGWNAAAPHGGLGQITQGSAKYYGVDYGSVTGTDTASILANLHGSAKILQAKAGEAGLTAADWANPAAVDDILRRYNGGADPDYVAHVRRYLTAGSMPAGGAAGDADARQKAMNDFLQGIAGPDLLVNQRSALTKQLGTAYKMRSGLTEGTVEYEQATEQIEKLSGALNDAQTQQSLYIRGLEDQAKAGTALYGGDQALLQVRQRIAELDRSTGHTTSPAEIQQAENAQIQIQTNLLDRQVAQINLAANANTQLAESYGQGEDAVRKATADIDAYRTALVLFKEGTPEFNAALATLKTAYEGNADASANLQQAQASLGVIENGTRNILDGFTAAASGATTWADATNRALQSVSDQLLQLAITNPIMNEFFGQHNPTLSSVGGILGSLLGNGASSDGDPWGGISNGGGGDPWGGIIGAVGNILGDVVGSAFASGGVMTSHGPMPLRRYAAGGIANSPQLAMFGEGSMPEAYVPLHDGRSIPVSLKGGSGGMVINQGGITVNVSNSNASPHMIAAAAEVAANRANARLLADINRGGRVAKMVGRRR